MKYRRMGTRVPVEVSALGFGCMRLPTMPAGEKRVIDRTRTQGMFETALAAGINYFDTAYPYHSGESERVVGELLCREHRDEFFLATKMPVWAVKEASDFDRIFNEQLEKLQTDRVDFYLVHAIDRERWKSVCDLGIREWLLQKQASGQIRYKGFSFHGGSDEFQPIIDDWADEWDFCQIQYNYIDVENQAGRVGLRHAASKGIGVVIMEPLLGGNLVVAPPAVQEIWERSGHKASPVERALEWLWDQPEVGILLSGMSSLEQVQQNIDLAGRAQIGVLTEAERLLFDEARAAYEAIRPIPCTECEYCLPCPNGVAIPRIFHAVNDAVAYAQPKAVRSRYGGVDTPNRADVCVECGECMEQCPQGIDIIEELKKGHDLLTA